MSSLSRWNRNAHVKTRTVKMMWLHQYTDWTSVISSVFLRMVWWLTKRGTGSQMSASLCVNCAISSLSRRKSFHWYLSMRWCEWWKANSTTRIQCFFPGPSDEPPGCALPRNAWLDKTQQAPNRSWLFCKQNSIHKFGLKSSSLCQCGQQQTADHFIDGNCPEHPNTPGAQSLTKLADTGSATRWVDSLLAIWPYKKERIHGASIPNKRQS